MKRDIQNPVGVKPVTDSEDEWDYVVDVLRPAQSFKFKSTHEKLKY